MRRKHIPLPEVLAACPPPPDVDTRVREMMEKLVSCFSLVYQNGAHRVTRRQPYLPAACRRVGSDSSQRLC